MKQIIKIVMTGYNLFPFSTKFCSQLSVANSSKAFSGFTLQFEHELASNKTKSHHLSCNTSILAVGGRYDELINSFKASQPDEGVDSNKLPRVGAVGVSLEIEKIVNLLLEGEKQLPETAKSSCVDIVLFSFYDDKKKDTDKFHVKEMFAMARELRSESMKVVCLPEGYSSVETLTRFCHENLAKLAIGFKEDPIQSQAKGVWVKIYAFEKERLNERKNERLSRTELLEYIKSHYYSYRNELLSPDPSPSKLPSFVTSAAINFLLLDKSSFVSKKKYENAIYTFLSNAFCPSSSVTQIIAVDTLPHQVLKGVAAEVDFDKISIDSCLKVLSERFSKYRKHFPALLEMIYALRTDKKATIIILINYLEMKFVILS